MNEESKPSGAWNDFYRNVAAQIDSNMKYYADFTENLTKEWIKFSDVFGTAILDGMNASQDDAGKEAMRELYNLWKNYNIKMNARMQRLYGQESQRYKEIMFLWEEDSKKISSMMGAAPESKDSKENPYAAWMDVAVSTATQIGQAVEDAGREYDDLKKTMAEFFTKADAVLSAMESSDAKNKELLKNLRGSLAATRQQIFDYTSLWSDSVKKFQRNWLEMMDSTRDVFSKTFSDMDYGEFYSQFLRGLGWGVDSPKDKARVHELEDEIKELKEKMKELEKTTEKKL